MESVDCIPPQGLYAHAIRRRYMANVGDNIDILLMEIKNTISMFRKKHLETFCIILVTDRQTRRQR